MAKTKVLICPYCGDTQPAGERCRACGGLFEPLSRQATHNEMGPWFIRNINRPFQPGCSYETLIKLIERGQITKVSILRGPTTKQFWTIARRVPGVAHLLGYCHNCDAPVDVEDHGCHACGVPFGAYLDRNYLGLPEVRPLPWEASADEIERQEAVAVSRTQDTRGAAEPLGISSFASDAELRGGFTPSNATAGVHAVHLQALSAAAGASNFSVNPDVTAVAPSPEDRPADQMTAINAASAAQRALDRQRQTIRWLLLGLMVALVFAVTTLIALVVRQNSVAEEPREDSAALTGDSEPRAQQSQTDQIEPLPTPSLHHVATMEQVQELTELVKNEDLPLQERIDAGDEALQLLKEMDSTAAPQQKPSDLAERIAALEKELDDLRLKAFFP